MPGRLTCPAGRRTSSREAAEDQPSHDQRQTAAVRRERPREPLAEMEPLAREEPAGTARRVAWSRHETRPRYAVAIEEQEVVAARRERSQVQQPRLAEPLLSAARRAESQAALPPLDDPRSLGARPVVGDDRPRTARSGLLRKRAEDDARAPPAIRRSRRRRSSTEPSTRVTRQGSGAASTVDALAARVLLALPVRSSRAAISSMRGSMARRTDRAGQPHGPPPEAPRLARDSAAPRPVLDPRGSSAGGSRRG